tara:strand:- start:183 stop:1901 length:1719 start_codon:yes stop_codon:yes gene_type:complete
MHSFGRCQYGTCAKEVVLVDPVSGDTQNSGEFAHILPVGDGPRADAKKRFPHINLNSAANLMLLCPEHHQLIDALEPDLHTPDVLFRMKAEKSVSIRDSITTLLETQSDFSMGIDDYQREYQVSEVMSQFKHARHLGPRAGRPAFQRAERTYRSLLKNPFFDKGEAAELTLGIEYHLSKIFLSYKRRNWRDALKFITRTSRYDLPIGLLSHLVTCSMVLVRDEYDLFEAQEKLALIKSLVDQADKHLAASPDDHTTAHLLLLKCGLVRWRGRYQVGKLQRSSYGEALRCCEKSLQLASTPGARLQSALISYGTGFSFTFPEAPAHQQHLDACIETLESPELADFPAAVKFRPRMYREIYMFEKSIETFWTGAERFSEEFQRIAYVLGEAAIGEHYHHGRKSVDHIADALEFLKLAIGRGYSHARNVAAYIACRGILEPEWFKNFVVEAALPDGSTIVPWEDLFSRIRNALYNPEDKYDEPTFGLAEAEFWNTIGIVTGATLKDHTKAIRLLGIAEKHSQVSSGRFRAFVSLAREHKASGDLSNYKRYLNAAKTVARAHHYPAITEIESLADQ